MPGSLERLPICGRLHELPRDTLTVLIADDHEVVCRGIRTLLEAQPEWKVCGEAATGGETIAKARELRPDVLLLDLTLPDMGAVEAIPEIMAVCPNVKIVALAMHDSGEMAAKALAAGACGVAMKSDAANDLLLTVQGVGSDRPFLSPAAIRLLQGQLAKNVTSATTPDDLTSRELELLKLLAQGHTNKEAAGILDISVKTVDSHRLNIMRKLKLASYSGYSGLIQFAIRHKIIEI